MNRRFNALTLSCLLATTAVACGQKSANGSIKDVYSTVKDIVDDDYSGIIASDARYSLNDSETIGYRSQIRKNAGVGEQWLIIAEDGDIELFYADGWDKNAKGYKKADPDGRTLAEIYDDHIGDYKDDDDDDDIGGGGMMGYVRKSKRSSANADARSVMISAETALTDADARGFGGDIGYIVIENGKITDFNSSLKDDSELREFIEDSISNYYSEISGIGCALVLFRGYGVTEVYIADSIDGEATGCYPASMDDLGDIEDIINEKTPGHTVEKDTSSGNHGGSSAPAEFTVYDGALYEENGIEAALSIFDSSTEINYIDAPYDERAEYLAQMINSGEQVDLALMLPFGVSAAGLDHDIFYDLFDCEYIDTMMSGYTFTYNYGFSDYKMFAVCVGTAPGGYFYHPDLAEQYFGVKTPEEMQAKIGDWDKFEAAGKELFDASGGKVAIADSVFGMCDAYAYGAQKNPLDRDYLPTADTEKFIQHVNNMWTTGSISKNGWYNDKWWNSMSDGSILGVFTASWGALNDGVLTGYAENPDYWQFCQGPASFSNGGIYAAIPETAASMEFSASFINQILTDEICAFSLYYGGEYTGYLGTTDEMNSKLKDLAGQYFALKDQNMFEDMMSIMANIPMRDERSYEAIMGEQIFPSAVGESLEENGKVTVQDIKEYIDIYA